MQTTNNNQVQFRTRINHFIRVPQVRVILSDGTNGGIMSTQDALKLAQSEGFDLIEINPKAAPPVCRIASFGKHKYEEKKKQAEAKKNAKQQEMKELTLKPNIAQNDLDHKIDQAKSFLADGNTCKVTCKFRGREVTHPQIGRDKLDYVIKQLGELIQPNPSISLEGKFMNMVIFPAKQKG
jgi:translation initiation factor IF-3